MSKKEKGVNLRESAEALARLTQQMAVAFKTAKDQKKAPTAGDAKQAQKKNVPLLG